MVDRLRRNDERAPPLGASLEEPSARVGPSANQAIEFLLDQGVRPTLKFELVNAVDGRGFVRVVASIGPISIPADMTAAQARATMDALAALVARIDASTMSANPNSESTPTCDVPGST